MAHATARDDAADRRVSSRCGCRSTIRCGSSIPAAPPACPSRSCTATAARCWWRWRSRSCTTTSAAATTPNSWGERYHWYSSTGWVMWNAQTSGLLNGTTCCIYDGNPGGIEGQARLDRAVALRRRTGRDVLRRGRGVLCQLHEGRRRPRGLRRPAAGARAGHDRLAAVGGCAALGNEQFRSSSKIEWQRRARQTSGGATSPAAPTSPAPSSAATASCRWCRARCSAACSAARSRPGTSRASR